MYYRLSFYSTCRACIDEFTTATNLTKCRKEETKKLHLELKLYAEKAFWTEKVNFCTNVKIGIYGHHKSTIRTLLNP